MLYKRFFLRITWRLDEQRYKLTQLAPKYNEHRKTRSTRCENRLRHIDILSTERIYAQRPRLGMLEYLYSLRYSTETPADSFPPILKFMNAKPAINYAEGIKV